jgi:uncharacterized phage-associated protein
MFEDHHGPSRTPGVTGRTYPVAMTISAHDVAAELRRLLPALGTKKLHKLLYYCQGHHLATFGEALFSEPIGAWDMGPVVERLWRDEKYALEPPAAQNLDEAGLNTVGYVVSRYGSLTGRDLEVMTHGETPWLLANAARRPRDRAPIRAEWLIEYFRTDGAAEDDMDDMPLDSAAVSAWLRETASDVPSASPEDSLDDLHAWATRDS